MERSSIQYHTICFIEIGKSFDAKNSLGGFVLTIAIQSINQIRTLGNYKFIVDYHTVSNSIGNKCDRFLATEVNLITNLSHFAGGERRLWFNYSSKLLKNVLFLFNHFQSAIDRANCWNLRTRGLFTSFTHWNESLIWPMNDELKRIRTMSLSVLLVEFFSRLK